MLLLTSCGGSDALMGGGSHQHDHSSGDANLEFGKAAATGTEPDLTVEIDTLDSLRFDPATVEIDTGDVVEFQITNPGRTDHEFVLGDEAYQSSHGRAGAMTHSDGNAVFVEPGGSETLTWEFTSSGEILYACHVSDHYSAGMVGEIAVR